MQMKISPVPFALLIGIAVVFQLALIGADSRQTPLKVAKGFAKSYYYLDADMEAYVCKALVEDERVGDFLAHRADEAFQRGLSTNYLRHKLTHLHLSVVESDDNAMQVHLTGTSRVCINPAFMVVGKLFQLAKDYPVDETLALVKEDGRWRVCGEAIGLNPQT